MAPTRWFGHETDRFLWYSHADEPVSRKMALIYWYPIDFMIRYLHRHLTRRQSRKMKHYDVDFSDDWRNSWTDMARRRILLNKTASRWTSMPLKVPQRVYPSTSSLCDEAIWSGKRNEKASLNSEMWSMTTAEKPWFSWQVRLHNHGSSYARW